MKNIAEEIRKIMPHSIEHSGSTFMEGRIHQLILGNGSEHFVGYIYYNPAGTASFYIIL